MSCLGPVSVGRSPAVVRPTTGACVLSSLHGRLLLCCLTGKCLHDGPLPAGIGASYRVASRWTPVGVPLRPNCVGGVASWSHHAMCLALPRTPRSRSWSRMSLIVEARGPSASRPFRKLTQRTIAAPFVAVAMPCKWLAGATLGVGLSTRTCYLVDPASSHMLVSKIKPCMCKYELI